MQKCLDEGLEPTNYFSIFTCHKTEKSIDLNSRSYSNPYFGTKGILPIIGTREGPGGNDFDWFCAAKCMT